jgi:O-antigen ligase
VGITAINLGFLPWALGGMHPWAQVTTAFISVVGLSLALAPRGARVHSDSASTRLFRFPIFWAGLAVLTYVAIQALNPSWRFVTDAKSWWLVATDHNPFLPSGVDAPFARSNPWRAMVIFGSPWLLACSVWVGFLRRQSYRLLFGAIVLGGALLAFLGLLQQMTGADRIFWAYRAPNEAQFMASFIYRNHAGAYFNLLLALAAGMAAWHWRRVERNLEGMGATVAFGFAAALIGIAVIFSASRMSIVLLIAFTLVAALAQALRPVSDTGGRPRRRWIVFAIAATCILGIGLVSFAANDVWARFATLVANPTATLQYRTLARKAAGEMFHDRWVFGWGAGCFRYGFPLYAQRYPEIYYTGLAGRKYWEHAHDDLLEFPLELGAVGMIPVVAGLGFAAWRLFRARFWRNPVSLCAAAACVLTMVHAWVDFVFQSPAIVATWAVLLVGAIRWSELESTVERKRIT